MTVPPAPTGSAGSENSGQSTTRTKFHPVRPVESEVRKVSVQVEFEDGGTCTYEVEQPRRVLVSVIDSDSFLIDPHEPETIEEVRRFRLDVKVGRSPLGMKVVEP